MSIQHLFGWEIISREGENVSIEVCQKEDLKGCEEVCFRAFLVGYEEFTPEELGVEDKEKFLLEAFADIVEEFKSGAQTLVTAKKEGEIIGFAVFEKTESPGEIYIAQLAVDPAHWQKGLGTHLVFAALRLYDDVDNLVVITRRINHIARTFYEKLGFEESTYMHPGYDSHKYIGYMLNNNLILPLVSGASGREAKR